MQLNQSKMVSFTEYSDFGEVFTISEIVERYAILFREHKISFMQGVATHFIVEYTTKKMHKICSSKNC